MCLTEYFSMTYTNHMRSKKHFFLHIVAKITLDLVLIKGTAQNVDKHKTKNCLNEFIIIYIESSILEISYSFENIKAK